MWTGLIPRLLVAWACNCLGLLLAAAIIPSVGFGQDAGTLLLAAAILGLVNFALRPLLILLTLPAVILTFGLALLLINALTLWLTSAIVSGLQVGDFWATCGAALIVSLVNLALRPWRRAARGTWSQRWRSAAADWRRSPSDWRHSP